MEWLIELGRRLLMMVRRKHFESDLKEEMRLHRELREQQHVEAGDSGIVSLCSAALFRQCDPQKRGAGKCGDGAGLKT
jgi:hypothetical protein